MQTKVQELQSNQIVILAAILTVVVTITSANGDFDWWDMVVGIIAFIFLSAFCKPNSTSRWPITVYNLALALCITLISAFPLDWIFSVLTLKTTPFQCVFNDYKLTNCLFDTTWLNIALIIVFVAALGLLYFIQRRQRTHLLPQQSLLALQPATNPHQTTSQSNTSVQFPASNVTLPAKTSTKQITGIAVMALAVAVLSSIILGRQGRH